MDIMKKLKFTKVQVKNETLDQWFKLADVNGDKQISQEEAERFVMDHMMQYF